MMSCTEKWSDEDVKYLEQLSGDLTEKAILSSKFSQSTIRFHIEQVGNRPADLQIFEESERVIKRIRLGTDSASFWQESNVSKQWEEDVIRLTDKYRNRDGNFSPLNKALLINEITKYYAQKTQGTCICFDTPEVKLFQSIENPEKFKIGAGSDNRNSKTGILNSNDNSVAIIDQLLNKATIPVEWQLIDKKQILFYAPED
jgi:hypothetical protein